MDAKSKRGCLWAAVGAGVLVLIVGAAVFGGVAWLVYQSSSAKSDPATPAHAAEQIAAVRARFSGQAPLIAIDDDQHATVVPRKRTREASLTPLRILMLDPKDERLKRVTLPFWVVRFSPGNGEIKIGDDSLRLQNIRITVKDIEEAGP